MSKIKEVFFTDILEYKSGKASLTKQYMIENIGEFPVYSAKTIGETVVGKINTYMFDIEGLQLTTNGANAGTWMYREKHKYSLNGDARLYFPKEEYKDVLYIKYLYYALKNAFKKRDFDWRTKATISNIANIMIKIPVLANGKFDLEKQRELAEKYEIMEEQKQALLVKVKELKKISVILPQDDNITWSYPMITDLFYPQGGNAEHTKTWVSENQGNYPLYSGTTTGEYAKVNKADYMGEYLTWCIDGLAGYIMYHNESFCLTCHRGVLLPTERCVNIDLRYVKYVLEPIFRRRKKGREGDLGKNEYTSLKPIAIKRMKDVIPIPVREDGTYDIDKQRELADKYEQIEEIKESLINRIIELTEIVVI